jgi:hypothetical protein
VHGGVAARAIRRNRCAPPPPEKPDLAATGLLDDHLTLKRTSGRTSAASVPSLCAISTVSTLPTG